MSICPKRPAFVSKLGSLIESLGSSGCWDHLLGDKVGAVRRLPAPWGPHLLSCAHNPVEEPAPRGPEQVGSASRTLGLAQGRSLRPVSTRPGCLWALGLGPGPGEDRPGRRTTPTSALSVNGEQST